MSENLAPIYIISSERSGSNFLRKRLSEVQEAYFGPSPAHFLKHLFYREFHYGDLTDDANFLKLIEDAVALTQVHFSAWNIQFDTQAILKSYLKEYEHRGVVELGDLLSRLYAQQEGYTSYLCKDNNVFDYAYPIFRYLPNAKFIYLHRDPRDYAVSQLQRKLATNSLYSIGKRWVEEQIKCISLMRHLGADRVLQVSYECLIQDEENQLDRICEFLGIPRLKEKREVAIDVNNIQEWENLNKPTITTNSGKYKRFLKPKQVELLESVCWRPMQFLGYQPETSKPVRISNLRRGWDVAYGNMTALIVKSFELRKKGMEGRRAQNELLKRLQT